MIVVRKFLTTLFWWFVFMFLCLIVLVTVVVLQIDMTGDQAAVEATAEAMGYQYGERFGMPVIVGSFAVAFLGSIFGWLPFSRHRKGDVTQTQ